MSKHEVLRGYGRFRLVLVRGERIYGRFLRASFLVSESVVAGIRVGIAVPKRAGTAVRRNRIKRLMRESIRPQRERLRACAIARGEGVEIVFQFHRALPVPQKLSLRDLAPDTETLCMKIIQKLSGKE